MSTDISQGANFVKSEDLNHACEAARRFINYRPRSEAELKIRLSKNYTSSVIKECIGTMYRENLLDDKRFAQIYVDSRTNSRHKSATMIRKELSLKGISKNILTAVTSDIDDEEQALKVSHKKARSLSSLPKSRFFQMMMSHMSRRGFTYSISHKAIEVAWSDIQNVES